MRVTDSWIYSLHLQGNYTSTDFINEQVIPSIAELAKFMEEAILVLLKEQFDVLCIEMRDILN